MSSFGLSEIVTNQRGPGTLQTPKTQGLIEASEGSRSPKLLAEGEVWPLWLGKGEVFGMDNLDFREPPVQGSSL